MNRRRALTAALFAAALLLAPAALTATAQDPPQVYRAPKSCTLDQSGLCHVNHPLGVVPAAVHCQPRIYPDGRAWHCSVVDTTTTGVTVRADNLDGTRREGWVRFYLVAHR